jgi:hypothetical protein
MNRKLLNSTLFFLCLTTQFVIGQNKQNGLILPLNTKDPEICCIYSPKSGFKVFNSPNGKEIGILTRTIKTNTGAQAPYRIFFVDKVTNKVTQIDLNNFQEIEYEILSIKYFERRNGFVRIVNKSVDYWLSEKEIKDKGFKLSEWQQFLIDKSGHVLGYYAKDPGLHLRAKPTTESKILKKLVGDLFEITPTEECEGNWTKVKVRKYKEHPCVSDPTKSENIEYELEGWIKIVDNEGNPNVWYYSRGC